MSWGWENYGDYVSADEKRRRAEVAGRKLEKNGRKLAPVHLTGRALAHSFWGKSWGQNLERYSDYVSRLPRGRSYLRQGAVLDLQMERGTIRGVVSGTRPYEVTIRIDTLAKETWTRLKQDCARKVGSLLELLQGKLSPPVMEIVTRQKTGLFPQPGEIHLACSCPDWAELCKHVAAILYGVGARLDEAPELLFALRGVDHLELIASATRSLEADLAATPGQQAATLDEGSLAEVFGIELDTTVASVATPASKRGKISVGPIRKSVASARKKQPVRLATKKTTRSEQAVQPKKGVQPARQSARNKSARVSTPTKRRAARTKSS